MPTISQSTVLVGGLIAGFVLYLAVNQRLGVYYGILIGTGGGGGAAPSPGSATLDPSSPNFNPAQAGINAGTWLRNWFGGLFGGGSTPAPSGGTP